MKYQNNNSNIKGNVVYSNGKDFYKINQLKFVINETIEKLNFFIYQLDKILQTLDK